MRKQQQPQRQQCRRCWTSGMRRQAVTSMESQCIVALRGLTSRCVLTQSWARPYRLWASVRAGRVAYSNFGIQHSTEGRAWIARKWVPRHMLMCSDHMVLTCIWEAGQTNNKHQECCRNATLFLVDFMCVDAIIII